MHHVIGHTHRAALNASDCKGPTLCKQSFTYPFLISLPHHHPLVYLSRLPFYLLNSLDEPKVLKGERTHLLLQDMVLGSRGP